jgi:hypothetical protein
MTSNRESRMNAKPLSGGQGNARFYFTYWYWFFSPEESGFGDTAKN